MSRTALLIAALVPLATVAGLLLAVVAWQKSVQGRDQQEQLIVVQQQELERTKLVASLDHQETAAAAAQASVTALMQEKDRLATAGEALRQRAESAEADLAAVRAQLQELQRQLAQAGTNGHGPGHPTPAPSPSSPSSQSSASASSTSAAIAPAPSPGPAPEHPPANGVHLP